MKAEFITPVDRDVVITMKESEAKLLREFCGGVEYSYIDREFTNPSEVRRIASNVYNMLSSVFGEV